MMATGTFTASSNNCNHKMNGRWFNIDFWIFTREFFICYDCGDIKPTGKWRFK